MTTNQNSRNILTARRLTLLGSAAIVGAALALGGVGAGQFSGQALAATTQTQAQGPAGFADLIAKVKPAVISVRVKMDRTADASDMPQMNGDDDEGMQQMQPFERFFRRYGEHGPRAQVPHHEMVTGVGSGFFISADGYAVTNNHVVDHATSVEITTDDGKTYTAKVIGTDAKTDLALIKVDGKSDFAYANLETELPRIGDWVVAVGNPYGLGGTVTAGIVSAEGRDIGSGPYDNYIQIDAPINKGNSGGPTFDTRGNVIGVNTAIFSPTGGSVGIGFDIPAATVKMVVAQLKDKGSVTRAYIGVQVQPVTADIASSLGMKTETGALVAEAQADTPAAKAGVQAGDVITAVNGNAIKDSRTLAREISGMTPGSTVKLDILRNGSNKSIDVTLAAMPNQGEKQAKAGDSMPGTPRLGLSVAPASEVAGAGSKGVVITAVDPSGPAAERGLKSGDVILDVAGKSVSSVGDLRSALADAKSGGKKDVLMRIKSAENTRFVAVPLG